MERNEILRQGLISFGIEVNQQQIEQFKTYMDTLLEYNKVMNLTAIEEKDEIYTKHFLDSASCLLTGKLTQGCRLIDVGTGAGFPSLPLKILRPDLRLTLMDSLNKRVNFLREVGRRLDLKEVEYLHSRAEDGGRDKAHRQQYDVAVARAVASLPVLLEYCIPFIRTGGYFICQKGPSATEEMEQSKKALELLGCQVEDLLEVEIPFTDLQHKIILIKKVKATDKAYPRKAGKPAKEPLL